MAYGKADTLHNRQIAAAVFITMIAGKLFAAPILLGKSGGRSAWIALAVFFAVDLLILTLFLALAHRHPKKAMTAVFTEKLGNIPTKIFSAAVALFLLLKTVYLLLVVCNFAAMELFGGVSSVVTVLPAAALLFLFGHGSFRALGRTGEILIFFIGIAIVCIVLLLVKSADITKVMPPFGEGSIGSPLLKLPLLLSGDTLWLFFISGGKEKRKGSTAAILFTGIAALVTAAIFAELSLASVMNLISVTPESAVTAVTGTSAARLGFGRVDKLVFSILLFAPLLAAGWNFRSAAAAVETALGVKRRTVWPSLIMAAAVAISILVCGYGLFIETSRTLGKYAVPGLIFLTALMCLLSIILKRKKKGGLGGEQNEPDKNL